MWEKSPWLQFLVQTPFVSVAQAATLDTFYKAWHFHLSMVLFSGEKDNN